jgi:hypothetical protein
MARDEWWISQNDKRISADHKTLAIYVTGWSDGDVMIEVGSDTRLVLKAAEFAALREGIELVTGSTVDVSR